MPNFRAGLVTALGEVGKNLLATFGAEIVTPPDPIQPQRLRLFVSSKSRVEIVLIGGPGELDPPGTVRAFFHMILGGEEVELQLDDDFAGRVIHIENADLSDLDPPDPVR